MRFERQGENMGRLLGFAFCACSLFGAVCLGWTIYMVPTRSHLYVEANTALAIGAFVLVSHLLAGTFRAPVFVGRSPRDV